ncbi:hypothetical protein [Labrys miyagiensis]|uniref:hypothetical protein n=1 Tax=Labrys miyagiensis TaxID=346912 RepID=UPI0024E168E6|nr:hypothetical protein [Labrys miyagiensis]
MITLLLITLLWLLQALDIAASLHAIGGAFAFMIALFTGRVSFIRNRRGYVHPNDF